MDGSSESYGEGGGGGGLGEFSTCTIFLLKFSKRSFFFGDISCALCFLFGNIAQNAYCSRDIYLQ